MTEDMQEVLNKMDEKLKNVYERVVVAAEDIGEEYGIEPDAIVTEWVRARFANFIGAAE